MGKMVSLSEVVKISEKVKKNGKTSGVITGCFDVLHIGHIQLFRFAKRQVDVLIVGVEKDETIKLSKGKNRPVHNLSQRSNVLAELNSIDYLFPMEFVANYDLPSESKKYIVMYRKIRPDYLITNTKADRFWKQKEEYAKIVGAKLLRDKRKRISASSDILQKIN